VAYPTVCQLLFLNSKLFDERFAFGEFFGTTDVFAAVKNVSLFGGSTGILAVCPLLPDFIETEHLVGVVHILFGVAVAVETPHHEEGLAFEGELHLLDGAVTDITV